MLLLSKCTYLRSWDGYRKKWITFFFTVDLHTIRKCLQFWTKIGITLDFLIPSISLLLFSFLFVWFEKYVDVRSCFDVTAWRAPGPMPPVVFNPTGSEISRFQMVKTRLKTTIPILIFYFHITISCKFHVCLYHFNVELNRLLLTSCTRATLRMLHQLLGTDCKA